MSRNYTTFHSCASTDVLWDCFTFLTYKTVSCIPSTRMLLLVALRKPFVTEHFHQHVWWWILTETLSSVKDLGPCGKTDNCAYDLLHTCAVVKIEREREYETRCFSLPRAQHIFITDHYGGQFQVTSRYNYLFPLRNMYIKVIK